MPRITRKLRRQSAVAKLYAHASKDLPPRRRAAHRLNPDTTALTESEDAWLHEEADAPCAGLLAPGIPGMTTRCPNTGVWGLRGRTGAYCTPCALHELSTTGLDWGRRGGASS